MVDDFYTCLAKSLLGNNSDEEVIEYKEVAPIYKCGDERQSPETKFNDFVRNLFCDNWW